jgi:hypothetical protein
MGATSLPFLQQALYYILRIFVSTSVKERFSTNQFFSKILNFKILNVLREQEKRPMMNAEPGE